MAENLSLTTTQTLDIFVIKREGNKQKKIGKRSRKEAEERRQRAEARNNSFLGKNKFAAKKKWKKTKKRLMICVASPRKDC